MKIKVIKKSAKVDSMCPWVIEVMDQGKAKIDSMCPWVIEVMDQTSRS
jgi:hypothetical protein